MMSSQDPDHLPKQTADTISAAADSRDNLREDGQRKDNQHKTPQKYDSSCHMRNMIRLVYKGKMISEKKTMKENNIEAKATIEMSLRLLGGIEVNEQMDTHETEEDREKKRKLDEGQEGKMTKPNDDMAHLERDIMEALKKIG